jgi:lipid-binding SYLF domain-containing protein
MKVRIAISLLLLGSAAGITRADQNKTDVVERLQSATGTLQADAKDIPDNVLRGVKCIGIVPSMIKGAFVVGAKHGRGVATCRLPNGSWSAPAFFTISGGSWGLQIGVQDVQLVLMIMTDEGMRHLMSDKFQIGGTASAAAGPVGRDAQAGTDWKVDTQILSYSKTKGVFAGIDLGGSWVEQDKDSTVALYGKNYTHNEILDGHVAPTPDAHELLAEVHKLQTRADEKKTAKKAS